MFSCRKFRLFRKYFVRIITNLSPDDAILVFSSSKFVFILILFDSQPSPIVISITLFLVFSAIDFVISASLQILIIMKLDLVSSSLVFSSSSFHSMINFFQLSYITKFISITHSWCFLLPFWLRRSILQYQLPPYLDPPAAFLVFTTTQVLPLSPAATTR